MSKSIDDRLALANVELEDGRIGNAYEEFRAIAKSSGLTMEQRQRTELGLARLTVLGANQDMVIRLIAWLTLAATLVAATVLLVASASRGGSNAAAFWSALAWTICGMSGCFLLLRFAELVDRSRVTEARLVLLAAKLPDEG